MKKLMVLAIPMALVAMIGCGNDSVLNPLVGDSGNAGGTDEAVAAEERVKPPKDTINMHNVEQIRDEMEGGEIRDDVPSGRGEIEVRPRRGGSTEGSTTDDGGKPPKDKVHQN